MKKIKRQRKILCKKKDFIIVTIVLLVNFILSIKPCVLRFNLYLNGIVTDAVIYKTYNQYRRKIGHVDWYCYKFTLNNKIYIGKTSDFERNTTHIGDTVTIMYLPCNPNKNDLKCSVDNFSLHRIAKLFK